MTDIDTAMDSVLKQIELWEETKTREVAARLQLTLTILKMLVGIEKFDELPAFSRYLNEVTNFIRECQKADEAKKKGATA